MRHILGLRNHKFAAAALASLFMLAVLACASLTNIEAGYSRAPRGRSISPPHTTIVNFIGDKISLRVTSGDFAPSTIPASDRRLGPLFWQTHVSKFFWHFSVMNVQWRAIGITIMQGRKDASTTAFLQFPVWIPAVLLLISPLLWLRRRLARSANPLPGHCPTCGYDLRATPKPGGDLLPRCPECGTAPTAAEPR